MNRLYEGDLQNQLYNIFILQQAKRSLKHSYAFLTVCKYKQVGPLLYSV